MESERNKVLRELRSGGFRRAVPELPDLLLAAHVPHGKLEAPILNGLHIETDGGDRSDALVELELVKDGGLASRVKPEQKNAFLLLAPL